MGIAEKVVILGLTAYLIFSMGSYFLQQLGGFFYG